MLSRRSVMHRRKACVLSAVVTAALSLILPPAAAKINPNFTPNDLVPKSDQILVLKLTPADANGLEYYGPGYAPGSVCKIRVRPHIIGDLNGPEASFKAVHGVVSAGWKKAGHSLRLEPSIPMNCKAKLSVPNVGLKKGMTTEHSWIIWWRDAKYN